MEFKVLFGSYRNLIVKRLVEIVEEKRTDYYTRFNTSIDVFDTLINFSTKGKMLRGSLFLFSAESYGKKIDKNLLNIASSLELMHSALLIHDDIMDNDELRRGEKTVFAKYKEDARKMKFRNPEHYGISMGIVVGDIALLMAEETASYCGNSYIKKLLQFYTRELILVGIGQTLDFSYGANDKEVSAEDIKKMYITKSARYSFSLPLGLGAIASESKHELKILEELGEKMGLIFQLIDDDLGMFGEEFEIGKTVGSDIRENKKTFMRSLLMQTVDAEQKNYINKIFGEGTIDEKEIERIRKIIIDSGVRDKIKEMISELYDESKQRINKLEIKDEFKKIYTELLEYNTKRSF